MEQGQTTEEGLPCRDAIAEELADAPCVGQLVRVRAHRDLGCAGGAAGAEVGRPVARANHAAADQAVHALPLKALREVVHAELTCALREVRARRSLGSAGPVDQYDVP